MITIFIFKSISCSVLYYLTNLLTMLYFQSLVRFSDISSADTAIGIGGGGIRECRRKCRPMLFLRRQKKCRRKGFHIFCLSFQVLQCC